MGPLGVRLAPEGRVTAEEAAAAFTEQAEALAEAGADLLVIETLMSVGEAEIAIRAGKATGLPVIAMVTVDEAGDCLDGQSAEDAVRGYGGCWCRCRRV